MQIASSSVARVLVTVCLFSGTLRGGEPERLEIGNGLRVILQTLPSARDVALVTFFDIGNDHDPPGRCGLAHLLEHVYVTAAAGKTPARTVDEFMKSYPRGWNAQTTDTCTIFATVFPPERLEAEVADAVARMRDLRIARSDLEREVPRLIQEVKNMHEAFPHLAARNRARGKIRPPLHGGRFGGVPDEVREIALDELQKRWRRFYRPPNALLVVAGKFDPTRVKTLLRRSYGEIPSGDEVPETGRRTDRAVPPPGDLEVVRVHSSIPNSPAHVATAYRVPGFEGPDTGAFFILVGRLQQAAFTSREFELDYPYVLDASVLLLKTSVRPGEEPAAALARVDSAAERALSAPLRAGEVSQTKLAFGFPLGLSRAAPVQFAGNVYGAALILGQRELVGVDSKGIAAELDGLSAEGLARVAKRVFDSKRRAVVAVVPED